MSPWSAYVEVLAERLQADLEAQVLGHVVNDPYGPKLLENDHTTTGKSWMDAEMEKHKHPVPFKPSLNHRVSVMNCTP